MFEYDVIITNARTGRRKRESDPDATFPKLRQAVEYVSRKVKVPLEAVKHGPHIEAFDSRGVRRAIIFRYTVR